MIKKKKKKGVYNAKIENIQYEIPNFTNLATNACPNKWGWKWNSITRLATTTALTTVKHKILNFSDLVKKSRLWCKNIKNGKKKFATFNYNNFMSNTLINITI